MPTAPASLARILGPSLVVIGIAIILQVSAQAVDVRVEREKTFDFGAVRTWGWSADEPGLVRMARTADADPEAMKARAEPVIFEAVTTAMMRHGLMQVTAQPDLTMKYFLLLTTTVNAQTAGQFLPATAMWGLPPFAPATQSLSVMDHGSLVLDLSSKGAVVWRGAADSNIKVGIDPKKQETILREAVRDLLKRYPSNN